MCGGGLAILHVFIQCSTFMSPIYCMCFDLTEKIFFKKKIHWKLIFTFFVHKRGLEQPREVRNS